MRYVLSVTIFFTCFIFGKTIYASSELVFDWVDDSHRLSWESEKTNTPTQWLLRSHGMPRQTTHQILQLTHQEGVQPTTDGEWFSIISKNQDDESISRHLLISIPGIENTVWQKTKIADGLLFQTQSLDGSFAVKQIIKAGADDFRLDVVIEIINLSDSQLILDVPIQLTVGPGLGEQFVEGLGFAEKLYSFVQPLALIDQEVRFFDDDEFPSPERNIVKGDIEWGGLQSRYFALLIKPEKIKGADFVFQTVSAPEKNHLPSRYFPVAGFNIPIKSLEANATQVFRYSVFAGPKSRFALRSETAAYTEILFSGLWQWMRALSFGLLFALETIHKMVPSWGLSIILLAIFVRILMYPIARRALMSQAAFVEVQKKIQPELALIKREYRGEEQSERILNLYKAHNVSPLAGLKPLLIVAIQIPIFVALFHVLGQAYELRDANFLWIATLAEPDKLFSFGFDLPIIGSNFNLLPFLMAITTLLTIKLSPAPAADESSQRRNVFFQVLMTLGFLLLFYPFPAGMVLYWTMANVLHLLQQFVVESYKQKL